MSFDTKSIMFQGTGSGVGKSLVVAAFCRILCQMGVSVAPFKAQNMALNSFVTSDGLEMGRAQVFQAEACGLQPDVRMNPILLKPQGDAQSQVVLMGKAVYNLSARSFYEYRDRHIAIAKEAYKSLARDFDVIVIEGAGSPAEINLHATDIVNMEMASYAGAPVVIIGDIDRGGVFAWLKGTYDLVPDRHRSRIAGFLINKFRGDISLLLPGLEQFKRIVALPFFGVLPWFHDITVDQEDGVYVQEVASRRDVPVKIVVIHLPRISNFTDFAPLSFESDVSLSFVSHPSKINDCDCIIIPGTKTTLADMDFLKESGWDVAIKRFLDKNTFILGICGGYQMLGEEIIDPHGIEGRIGTSKGLGFLPITTEIGGEKCLQHTTIVLDAPPVFAGPLEAHGYEIHMGRTKAVGSIIPLGQNIGPEIGAISTDRPVMGLYLHGFFENDLVRRRFLDYLRVQKGLSPVGEVSSYRAFRNSQFDLLADWFRNNVDMAALLSLIGLE
ncbi:MAG: cobyric acid synthase [Dissulfurimicrobium sp.]|uniref:cobyric acid synthase n=1 Tax=Dissulfurimicrobium sp. TaxID=2022436 RepID=UPI00404B45E1